jgi:hypothetical protein
LSGIIMQRSGVASMEAKKGSFLSERNPLFGVTSSVCFRHELVKESSSDGVAFFSSPFQRRESLRSRVAIKEKTNSLKNA